MSSKLEQKNQLASENVVDLHDHFAKNFPHDKGLNPFSINNQWVIQKDEDEEEGGGEDGDGGDSGEGGIGRLIPDEQSEFEQRQLRRAGEAQYGEHVKDARHPEDLNIDEDLGVGMGRSSGVQAHPLLADMPQGADSLSPLERMMAADSDAARIELKRQLQNKLSASHTSSPTFTRG